METNITLSFTRAEVLILLEVIRGVISSDFAHTDLAPDECGAVCEWPQHIHRVIGKHGTKS